MDLLPLETAFIKKAKKMNADFPRPIVNYGERYKALTDHLRANIYPQIDTGLSANSPDHGFYTAHNSEHFDEVIHYAGKLLGVEKGDEAVTLSAYELYILLVSIRIHDAGNIEGRLEHEKKCFSILLACGALAGDDNSEKKVISKIAQAHGGKTTNGDKDTISELSISEPVGKTQIRSRLIASIVRFADEICESRNRAATYALTHSALPKHSQIFHKYAASISACVVSHRERRLTLVYKVPIKDVICSWGCAITGDKTETYLIDEILERLEKMDRERRYCNRFSRELYTIDTIRASIEITDKNLEVVELIAIPELCDSGYPEDNPASLKIKLEKYCSLEFRQRLSEKVTAYEADTK